MKSMVPDMKNALLLHRSPTSTEIPTGMHDDRPNVFEEG
jgi:hypothetical protein